MVITSAVAANALTDNEPKSINPGTTKAKPDLKLTVKEIKLLGTVTPPYSTVNKTSAV